MNTLPAGTFSHWLDATAEMLANDGASDVPCRDCIACCSSSQFVHVRPEDTAAMEHIPADLLFAAPGAPAGHLLMGYDEQGCCPMLVEGRCSIYEHRPLACRQYDCRVFTATGVVPDKPLIRSQIVRWRFEIDDSERLEKLRSSVDHSVEPPTVRAVVAIGMLDT